MGSGKPSVELLPFRKRYPNEASCRKKLCNQAMAEHPYCPKCRRKPFQIDTDEMKLFCPVCGSAHLVVTKTIFDNQQLPLPSIFELIWLLSHQEKGLTTNEIMSLVKIKSYRTCRLWVNKIRLALSFFPMAKAWEAVEVDSFLFQVKSRMPDGTIISKAVTVSILIGKSGEKSKLMKMAASSAIHKYEINQMIRELLSEGGKILAPDRSWFYSDERRYYRVGMGERSTANKPYCRLKMPNEYAKAWLIWCNKYYRNNIEEPNLQGYLNAFVFQVNRPRYPESGEYFSWIIQNLLHRGKEMKGQGRHPVPRHKSL